MHLKLRFAALLLGLAAFGFAATANAQGNNIVDTAAAAGSFNTLSKALAEAGLTEVLKGTGPYTVFAPTDEAFAKIPKEQLDLLFKDKVALKRVLSYHIVTASMPGSEVATLNGKVVGTLAGTTVRISVKDGKVQVNGANVTRTDVAASNGLIHVIDAVLMPPEKKKK